MKRLGCQLLVMVASVLLALAGQNAESKESAVRAWPQFRGPSRDGIAPETGLLAEWPADGPPLLWSVQGLGDGYSSVSIADGRLFTMGDRRGDGDKAQFVIALDLETRKELWATRVGPPHGDGGPRSTPTIDADRVYALGTSADLVCLEAATGKELWRKNIEKDFGGAMMSGWRWSESVLIDGDKLLCTPGSRTAAMAALNKLTGETIWQCALGDVGSAGKNGAGYSSIVVAEVGGVRQYIQLMGRGLIGVAAADGKLLWSYNKVANGVANISSPLVRGNYVFASTAYQTGSALLKLTPDGGGIKAEEVYFLGADVFSNHHGGVVLVGDHIYGGDGQNAGAPTCLEFMTGKVAWKERAPHRGSAAALLADGRLYFRYEDHHMTLVEPTPTAYKQTGAFKLGPGGKGKSWPHVAILDGKLYVRHADVLLCYDVRKP